MIRPSASLRRRLGPSSSDLVPPAHDAVASSAVAAIPETWIRFVGIPLSNGNPGDRHASVRFGRGKAPVDDLDPEIR